MKFKCGPSAPSAKEISKKWETMENWHDHFAWWPVRIARGDCRWFETVQRRYFTWHSELGGYLPSYREKPR